MLYIRTQETRKKTVKYFLIPLKDAVLKGLIKATFLSRWRQKVSKSVKKCQKGVKKASKKLQNIKKVSKKRQKSMKHQKSVKASKRCPKVAKPKMTLESNTKETVAIRKKKTGKDLQQQLLHPTPRHRQNESHNMITSCNSSNVTIT